MPRRICCVPECLVVAENGIPLHYFPCPVKDAKRFRNWVKVIGGDIAGLDSTIIHKTRRICRLHFQDEFLYPKNRLSKLAVPSLLLPSADVSGVPKITDLETEHNYCLPRMKLAVSSANVEMVTLSSSDVTQNTEPKNEKNALSNLATYWKSATGEEQHDDQPGSNPSALSDAADDAGSSDDDNIQEPRPPPQLNLHTAQMCRVCLALDVKMFDLRDTELKTMFQTTTGITFEENKGSKLGSLICWECAARLQAASKFIRKALFSESLLKGLIKKGEQIQKQYFETVKDEADSFIPPKTLTVTEIVHIVEIEDQNNMTQLVQSGDDDEPLLSENDDTEEIMIFEIKEQIIDENSKMDVEGDKDVAIKTGIKDDPKCSNAREQNKTKTLKEYPLDSTSSIKESINSDYSRPLLDIGHTSLRSDSTSPQQDFDEEISKTFIKTITKSKISPKQNIKLKNPIKRSQEALSHDHEYFLKGNSEDGNKKKKIKIK